METDLIRFYDALPGDMLATLALMLVAGAGVWLVVRDAFGSSLRELAWTSGAVLAAGMLLEVMHLDKEAGTAFYGMIRTGGYASFVNIVILSGGLLTVALSPSYWKRAGQEYGEVYTLILFATVGMMVLGAANHMAAVFIGLETMSVSLYVMAGLLRGNEGSAESALKYFLLGAFATGFFLYGIALMYGSTGTMYLPEMAAGLESTGRVMLFRAGVALLLIGFFFKVGAVPFHMWTPDVYQGAPTTMAGYMSTTSKAAAFGALILILRDIASVDDWRPLFAVVATVTMVLGNLLAVVQSNVKRMLAYSSIAHGGYILVGLTAGGAAGWSGALYYLLVYTLMNIGAFGVMAFLEWDGKAGCEQTLDSLTGVGLRKPLLGVAMGCFMFSLAGFPPFGGFLGKYAVFAPAVDAGYAWLVVAGVLASVVSAFYYLRVLYVFFMRSPEDASSFSSSGGAPPDAAFSAPLALRVVLVACAAALLVLGIAPGLLDVTLGFF